ncbi:hypothetical protein TSH58_05145 [Azospirillum sp. TSH58]|nr:hypothetical protein TSH58_05145 [Azospirillum sp. TSH58]
MEAAGTACANVAAYDALTWVRVKRFSSYGEIGETAAAIEYTDVDEGEDHVLKGPVNRGEFQIELNWDPSDPGQTAMQAAFEALNDINVKVAYNDDPGGTNSKPTRLFFPAAVMSWKHVLGDGKRVIGLTYSCRINGRIMKGDRAPGTP